jgi:hypothetical protein
MPLAGFEPTISVLERAKTVRALDRAATAIGKICFLCSIIISRLANPMECVKPKKQDIADLLYVFCILEHTFPLLLRQMLPGTPPDVVKLYRSHVDNPGCGMHLEQNAAASRFWTVCIVNVVTAFFKYADVFSYMSRSANLSRSGASRQARMVPCGEI